MDPLTTGLVGLFVTAVLLVIGMPIGFTLLFVGFGGVAAIRGFSPALSMLGREPFGINAVYSLSVVPLFVLMGHLTFASGISQGLFKAARQWLGHFNGGLVMATTVANAGFAAASGSTTAATAVFGRVAMPEMLRYGTDRRFAAGCVAAAGTMSAMIPPSVLLVMYGIVALESIPSLLVAGLIPGAITVAMFMVMIYARSSRNPGLAPPITGITWADRFRSLKGIWGIMVLAALVMGGIYMGWFTPTEGGAIGGMGAFLLVLAHKKFTLAVLSQAFLETARTTAVIFIVVTGAQFFMRFMGFTGIPADVSRFLIGLSVPPYVILIGIMLMYIVLGFFLDSLSMMFLTLPIILPAVKEMGFDPIWFGILVVKTMEIGLITPPLGLNCFMLKSVVPELSLRDIFSGSVWFVVMELVTLAILMAFPQIVLWLPATMGR